MALKAKPLLAEIDQLFDDLDRKRNKTRKLPALLELKDYKTTLSKQTGKKELVQT
jgi:hypothetical protein